MKLLVISGLLGAAGVLFVVWWLLAALVRRGLRWAARKFPIPDQLGSFGVSREEVSRNYPALRDALVSRLPMAPLRPIVSAVLNRRAEAVMGGVLGFMQSRGSNRIDGVLVADWFRDFGADLLGGFAARVLAPFFLYLAGILLLAAGVLWIVWR
jgi:hypothetical protein